MDDVLVEPLAGACARRPCGSRLPRAYGCGLVVDGAFLGERREGVFAAEELAALAENLLGSGTRERGPSTGSTGRPAASPRSRIGSRRSSEDGGARARTAMSRSRSSAGVPSPAVPNACASTTSGRASGTSRKLGSEAAWGCGRVVLAAFARSPSGRPPIPSSPRYHGPHDDRAQGAERLRARPGARGGPARCLRRLPSRSSPAST